MSANEEKWIAEHLDKHRQQIRILDEQVAALNFILQMTLPLLSDVQRYRLHSRLTEEAERAYEKMEESQEPEKSALDAGRKLILAAGSNTRS